MQMKFSQSQNKLNSMIIIIMTNIYVSAC